MPSLSSGSFLREGGLQVGLHEPADDDSVPDAVDEAVLEQPAEERLLGEVCVGLCLEDGGGGDLLVVEVEDADHHVDHDEDGDESVDQEEEEDQPVLAVLLDEDVGVVRGGQQHVQREDRVLEVRQVVDVVLRVVVVLLVLCRSLWPTLEKHTRRSREEQPVQHEEHYDLPGLPQDGRQPDPGSAQGHAG